jgi:TonB family protein
VDTLSRLAATFLLNALWQVTLIAGLALLTDCFLRRAPARFRHTLWVIALAAAVALPLSSLRSSIARPGSVTFTLGAAVPVSGAPSGQLSAGFWLAAESWVKQAAQDGIPLPQPWARALLVLYATFLSIQVVRFSRLWRRAHQIGRRASPLLASTRISAIVAEFCGVLGSPAGPLRVLVSPEIPGPVTVGARRPAIVLPDKLLEEDHEAELRAALAHEMAHVRRRDYLRNLIHEFVLLPISVHPLALLIRHHLVRTRELACDEMAASVLGRRHYARSLVRMAHEISRFPSAPEEEFKLGVFDADILEDRVMRLLDSKPLASTRLAKVTLLAGAMLIAACCMAAARFSVAAAPDAAQTAKPGGESGIITGIVVDSSGTRLSNASVWLKRRRGSETFIKTTVTDAAGNFSFADVAPGRYTLEADSPGKASSYRTITVRPGGWPPFFPFVLESRTVAGGGTTHATMPGETPKKLRINGAVEDAKLISQPHPRYPASAKARRIQGMVEIDAIISAAGVPDKLRVVRSPDTELSKAALDAVRQWRYRPTLLNGKPIAVETTIDVDFTLRR